MPKYTDVRALLELTRRSREMTKNAWIYTDGDVWIDFSGHALRSNLHSVNEERSDEYNHAIHGFESFLLALAAGGLVTQETLPAFGPAIQSTLDTIANNT